MRSFRIRSVTSRVRTLRPRQHRQLRPLPRRSSALPSTHQGTVTPLTSLSNRVRRVARPTGAPPSARNAMDLSRKRTFSAKCEDSTRAPAAPGAGGAAGGSSSPPGDRMAPAATAGPAFAVETGPTARRRRLQAQVTSFLAAARTNPPGPSCSLGPPRAAPVPVSAPTFHYVCAVFLAQPTPASTRGSVEACIAAFEQRLE